MTRLEQTIDQMSRINRLIGSSCDIARLVLFTNRDLFNAKIERKPLGEMYPDYQDYLPDSKETVRARFFLFDKLFGNQFNQKEPCDERDKLQCICFDVSPFDTLLNEIYAMQFFLTQICSFLTQIFGETQICSFLTQIFGETQICSFLTQIFGETQISPF